MHVRRLRFWLPLLSAAMIVGSVAVLAYALIAPCQVDVPSARRASKTDEKSGDIDSDKAVSMQSLEPLLARRFQSPLYDPPPEAPPVVVEEKPPPPQVKLLATMPEPGGGSAMLSDRSGSVLIKPLGSEIEDGQTVLKLIEIGNDHVVIERGEERFTLTLGKG